MTVELINGCQLYSCGTKLNNYNNGSQVFESSKAIY